MEQLQSKRTHQKCKRSFDRKSFDVGGRPRCLGFGLYGWVYYTHNHRLTKKAGTAAAAEASKMSIIGATNWFTN